MERERERERESEGCKHVRRVRKKNVYSSVNVHVK